MNPRTLRCIYWRQLSTPFCKEATALLQFPCNRLFATSHRYSLSFAQRRTMAPSAQAGLKKQYVASGAHPLKAPIEPRPSARYAYSFLRIKNGMLIASTVSSSSLHQTRSSSYIACAGKPMLLRQHTSFQAEISLHLKMAIFHLQAIPRDTSMDQPIVWEP